MNYKISQDILTICLPERIDTSTASDIGAELNGICSSHPHSELILDASATTYIASSGLRIILILAKQNRQMRVIGTQPNVFSVFDMTGFTRIVKIEKALRRIELREENLLALGGNGAVYRLSDEEIVKVNFKPVMREELQKEIDSSQEALICGVPTAISYDVVDCGEGRLGTVYEAIKSDNLSSLVMKCPDRFDELVDQYVSLLHTVHSNNSAPANLPKTKAVMAAHLENLRDTKLPSAKIDTLLRLLDVIPEADTLVHGDCHPKNVMMMNGELLYIDIADISIGHPMVDFLMYAVISRPLTGSIPEKMLEQVTGFTHDVRERFFFQTLKRYFGYDDTRVEWLLQLLDNMGMLIMATSILHLIVKPELYEAEVGYISRYADRLDSGLFDRLRTDLLSWAEDFRGTESLSSY